MTLVYCFLWLTAIQVTCSAQDSLDNPVRRYHAQYRVIECLRPGCSCGGALYSTGYSRYEKDHSVVNIVAPDKHRCLCNICFHLFETMPELNQHYKALKDSGEHMALLKDYWKQEPDNFDEGVVITSVQNQALFHAINEQIDRN